MFLNFKSTLLLLLIVVGYSKVQGQNGTNKHINFPNMQQHVEPLPSHDKVWVFIMAGQSNMAGRPMVMPEDTVTNERIFTINKNGELILAKEPLHWYEPQLTGLDCGHSFANQLLANIPEDISLLIIPTAVGGSSVSQWLGDSLHRDVKLLSNFNEKVEIGKKYGEIKGLLWHQGENDANEIDIPLYKNRLKHLFKIFRMEIGNKKLPVVVGELGAYSESKENWMKINKVLASLVKKDKYAGLIYTGDLKDQGDKIHFDGLGQRTMGRRFAAQMLKLLK